MIAVQLFVEYSLDFVLKLGFLDVSSGGLFLQILPLASAEVSFGALVSWSRESEIEK